MGFEANSTLSMWQHLAIWVPITVTDVAGAAAAGQGRHRRPAMGLYMHGFGGEDDHPEPLPEEG